MTMNGSQCFVGNDVSKARLDVAVVPQAQSWSEANEDTGMERLARSLNKLMPHLTVIESTGGLDLPL
jgi:transposase